MIRADETQQNHVVTPEPSSHTQATHTRAAYLYLALSMSLVGAYVGISKLLVAVLPVMLLAWMRFAIAAIPMAPWLRRGDDEWPLTAHAHRLLFMQSLLGNFLFTLCALYGTALTSALSAGVMFATIPVAVALLSRIFLQEHITRRMAFALLLTVSGIAMLALARSPNRSALPEIGPSSELLGYALLLGAVFCEASYVVIGKRLSAQVSAKRVSAIINLWGLILATPLGLYFASDFDFSQITLKLFGLLLFYALSASIFTVWLWMRGLQHVPAQHAGIFTAFLPLSASAIGLGVLGEQATLMHAAAALTTGLGLVLATWPARTEPSPQTDGPAKPA